MEKKIYEPDLKRAKKPFYNLMMFPYPSAEGLHVGNMYAFVGSDVYGRFKRMNGYDVFEPIGLDGFGIHSENFALKIGAHPMKQAKVSEKRFYKQLKAIGNGFAWNERLETYNPDYYCWTQWIFVQMFKNGLAYRKKSPVNWCPSCKTVLADEQVIDAKCERCGSEVMKKELEQWFFKITDYAERLLKNLDKIDWSEKVKIAQRNWIGQSRGAEIEFKIKNLEFRIKVFTTRLDTIFGCTYLVLAPENKLIENLKIKIKNWGEVERYIKTAAKKTEIERTAEIKGKTGVELKGVKAVNPANNEEIPVYVADYILGHYGTGAIMAVPAHDQRDRDFAKKFKLLIIDKPLISFEEALKKTNGKKKIQYRLRDWLISRQRYWGAPIPMIYCKECKNKGRGERKDMSGWYAVNERNLPVKLPYVKDFRPKGTGQSPLALVKSFYETKCPECGSKARRETDVSDTFLDSAWYYLRYPSIKEIKSPWNSAVTKRWLPVDMYIGGAEHAVLHLLYSRFTAMAFYDWGLVNFEEPFKKFRAHGLLVKEGAKMSKSKGNVVNPDEYIKKFGADVLRMYLMFLAPFEQGGDFRDAGIMGIKRFLRRVNKLVSNSTYQAVSSKNSKLERLLHQTIKKITHDIENLHFNTAISSLMILFNEMEKNQKQCDNETVGRFLKLLVPFAPHLSEELWKKIGEKGSIHLADWPGYDSKLIEERKFELIIQINGKMRDKILAQRGISREKSEKIVLGRERIKNFIAGAKIRKIIFVPDKLINIVL